MNKTIPEKLVTDSTADVVICGAGIAGVSAAYHLAVVSGIKNVVLVDERAPLTLTSDKSTECYRNWWPGPGDAMVGLMNRSIDILEQLAHESGNFFQLNRLGYLYASADPARVADFETAAQEAAELGAGPARVHRGQSDDPAYVPALERGFEAQPTGADLFLDSVLIQEKFPYLSQRVVVAVHARRCGWFSAQQLGMYLLERAREHGVQLVRGCVDSVCVKGGRIQSVCVKSEAAKAIIATRHLVNAAGPLLKPVGRLIGVDLPVFSELHIKIAFDDHLGVVPRDAPMLIWTDPTPLPWSEEERALLAETEETRWLLNTLPAGVHARPEGGPQSKTLLMLWAYDTKPLKPVFPFKIDPHHAEIALRGLSTMIPGLEAYFDRIPKPEMDGGYYTKTQENRPLIGPLQVEGAYVIGALSGFGLMAACAAGELLANHLSGSALPHYAPAFSPDRYEDPEYRKLLENWEDSGQL